MGGNSSVSAERDGVHLSSAVNLDSDGLDSLLVISCNVMKNDMWPLVAITVSMVPSLGRVKVMLLECRGAGMISILSWL